jgi:hypothetical protein
VALGPEIPELFNVRIIKTARAAPGTAVLLNTLGAPYPSDTHGRSVGMIAASFSTADAEAKA